MTTQKPKATGKAYLPQGVTRLVLNIEDDLHTKLKVAAAMRSTTMGELVADWVRNEVHITVQIGAAKK